MNRFACQALGLLGATCLGAVAATPASALNIVLNPDATFAQSANGAAALLGFQKAANYWNKTITTNATINLNVSFAALGANTLAQAGSARLDTLTTDIYRALAANSSSALDATAVANLRPLSAAGGLAFRTPGINPATGKLDTAAVGSFLDNNDTANNRYIWANTSLLKGLGLLSDVSNPANPDAAITFSSNFAFDYDPSNGIDVGKYDFVGVAIHEMGHSLGFVSGTDYYDYYSAPNGPAKDDPEDPLWGAAERDAYAVNSVLDLFRYGGNNPTADGTYQLQLDPNRPAFFSVDARNPFIFNEPVQGEDTFFSTGRYNGDGQQASHWKDAATGLTLPNGCFVTHRQVGVMDPTGNNCANEIVTAADLAAMDAMGWNINQDIAANRGYFINTKSIWALDGLAALALPEPATWAQMILGFGLLGAAVRRRRSATTVAA